MGVYDDFVSMANDMLPEFGERCIWRQRIATYTDPAKPWEADDDGTATDNVVYIFWKPTAASTYRSASGGEGYSDQLLDRETQSSKRIGLMAAPVGFTPNLEDIVYLSDGTVLHPRVFDLVNPGGTQPIMWSMSFDAGEDDPNAPTGATP